MEKKLCLDVSPLRDVSPKITWLLTGDKGLVTLPRTTGS